MSVKLSVSRKGTSNDTSSEHLFQDERVTIGRGQANHLTLPAPRHAVSMEHAVLEQTDDACRLTNCSSVGDTRLNEQRIAARTPHEVQEGDVCRIGDFRIEIQFPDGVEDASVDGEEADGNPFEEPVGELIDALEAVAETYEKERGQARDDALADALNRAHGPVSSHEAVQRSIGLLQGEAQSEASDSSSGDGRSAPARVDREVVDVVGIASPVLDTLADVAATVFQLPRQFQGEFLGHSFSHPSDLDILYAGEGQHIKHYLLDASATMEERKKRLRHVEEAAEALTLHQIAMLEGYKASVIDGIEALLSRFDPEEHKREVADENEVLKYIPMSVNPVVFQRMRAEWEDLMREDWAVAEQRIFRPAFTKAYLDEMEQPHAADTEEGEVGS